MAVCIKDCIQNMNLVIGCTIGCSYCYARNNVRRFHMIDDFEKPEFFPNKLRLMEKKRPQNFLLTGMSDFSHWKTEWREQIFDKMTENPQHQYLFLTKRPEDIVFSTTLENAWFGVSVTSSKEKNRIRTLREHIHGGHYHVTFEPMFDEVGMVDLTGIEWIVIGTETGHRKGKAVSKPEWVWNLTHQAHALGIPVIYERRSATYHGRGTDGTRISHGFLPGIGGTKDMAEVKESGILIQDAETKNIMTKSTLPVGGYSVNPYVGCTHGCKYCYASFMKRFTGHTEPWGTFLDVKHWPAIKNPQKYKGQCVVIGSVTDGYLPQEAQFQNTRKLLEQLRGSEAEILICTKSDLVIRDIDLLKKLGKVTVAWSINTLDEGFKNDMDDAVSIKRRLEAMKQIYDAGIRTVCFIAPVFPGITDFEAIFHQVRNQCDLIWLENLNLRGGFKKDIMDYICKKYPDLVPLYDAIYNKGDRSYFRGLEDQAERLAQENSCPFVDNELPYGRAEPGHPVIVNYFYHEEVRGSENTGRRNPKK